MTPTIGRIVHYKLSEKDEEHAARRRANRDLLRSDAWPKGAQAHVGNPVIAGHVVPMVVVAVWPDEYGPGTFGVNGQAFLDGNDVLWVTSAREGDEPGCWSWPPRAE